ncbi:MAG TPA: 3'-5' exonuclease, partial [Hyphomicrobiaceae bacterium]|nr:3'-5' exonuclease [Hyphomicrobiaceae bacterium]
MADSISFMPLGSIDAIVFDTETTGLDARKARIIQIGGITIAAGAIDAARSFEALVDPGQPIPPSSTVVHGISDADVAGKPPFREVYDEFRRFAGTRLLIGHSIFYDFAIFREECRLAGLPWVQPRSLDLRNLARVAAP